MRPRDETLLQYARDMRHSMTKEEFHLWADFLRAYPVRFRRQEIIGPYIADFYCSKCRLVVELDGSQHYEWESVRDHDAERTSYLNQQGIEVIRFQNGDVNRYFEGVCIEIDRAVNRRMVDLGRKME